MQITWTAGGECWLRRIYNYLAQHSLASAKKVTRGIQSKTKMLKRFPRLGYRFEEVTDREIRILLYGHYQIAYEIESESKIKILGVIHASMDLSEQLKPDLGDKPKL